MAHSSSDVLMICGHAGIIADSLLLAPNSCSYFALSDSELRYFTLMRTAVHINVEAKVTGNPLIQAVKAKEFNSQRPPDAVGNKSRFLRFVRLQCPTSSPLARSFRRFDLEGQLYKLPNLLAELHVGVHGRHDFRDCR